MTEPRVTILMPVHNEARYLAEAIRSILAQDFDAWRLWILDDGSTDGTRKVAERYRAQDPRIEVHPNAKNMGRTMTLNVALGKVITPLCARHDGDDRSLPDRLSKQVALLDVRPEVGLCSSFMQMIDESGRDLKVWRYPTGSDELRQAMMSSNCICHGAVVFRTKLAQSLGGYRELFRYAEDYDLWLRMMAHADLEVIPEPLYDYRMHPAADSQSKNYEQLCEVELILELAWERRRGDGTDTLDKEPKQVSARLHGEFSDADARLAYYLEQYGNAKQYIAELEQYRDDLLRQLRDRKEGQVPAGSGLAARLRSAFRAFRDG